MESPPEYGSAIPSAAFQERQTGNSPATDGSESNSNKAGPAARADRMRGETSTLVLSAKSVDF
jgi:hypothetical protein